MSDAYFTTIDVCTIGIVTEVKEKRKEIVIRC